ncbi:MAG: transcription initiation factor IIA small subunit [Lasallia pustulata]|uniref:Transcription initiation factor IIA small subunit n=1 Tax=Lasallia pustulata TaxID=136370 RepID=A0A5M8PES6_9LECA|nr:MAG: transcription initiation factor IIA small subunit [Lasallia pustulata]
MDAAAEPLLPAAVPPSHPPPHSHADPSPRPSSPQPAAMATKTPWLAYAISSGACAAFNGVFAKLTTTDLTTTWARAIASALGLAATNKAVEFLVRALFFALNLAFNGVMWTLFTKALTRSSSTMRVSIVNTSANFMLTALLGLMIFGEALPPLWWGGRRCWWWEMW